MMADRTAYTKLKFQFVSTLLQRVILTGSTINHDGVVAGQITSKSAQLVREFLFKI